MSDVGLLYVGGVLFLNSIMLLGRVEGKSAGVFNLFVGVLQVITPLYLIFQAQGNAAAILGASGIFLFGFTYLYVGITNLCNLDTTGVGWYSLWVAILAIGYSLVNFFYFGDLKFGIIWLMWSFLWALFFILLALKRNIGRYTGFVALIQSWITATIPAFLSLVGIWQEVSLVWVWLVTVVTVGAFVYLYLTKKKYA
jgi:putative amide transporter protein